MTIYLSSENFPSRSAEEQKVLRAKLDKLLNEEVDSDFYALLSRYQRLLADNRQRLQWPALHDKLQTLFMCGTAVVLEGPMVGIPVSIRDSDFFKAIAQHLGRSRSLLASIELLGSAWNATFADTGLWMGKTFEPVSREVVKEKCTNDAAVMANYTATTTRIGRNFFREPPNPNLVQSLGLPTLTKVWNLKERPVSSTAAGFDGELLEQNLAKERMIPYSQTGGIFLADRGASVVPEMCGKQVYQLNYRWPALKPAFPMSCLIDEIVQIAEGIYLGQLVFATKHFSLGTLDLPLLPEQFDLQLGESYAPNKYSAFEAIRKMLTGRSQHKTPDYGYQNNGFFLMMDPAFAERVYADEAFPQLRPRAGEAGYVELGYDRRPVTAEVTSGDQQWLTGWQQNEGLRRKFTTLLTEPSPRGELDSGVHTLLQPGESVLQMLQRLSNEISAQTKYDDHLRHFEKLHMLFRCGIAPRVVAGLFQGQGRGFNVRVEGKEARDGLGDEEIASGFDYYHGATLNLHWGFTETFRPDIGAAHDEISLFPGTFASSLLSGQARGPNVLNILWATIGKYIFPWAGKSFERITPRRLSLLLDESSDLAERYPARVASLKKHIASAPHYDVVKRNRDHYWGQPGRFADHLHKAWDQGMSAEERAFWTEEAQERWVLGYNLQDQRILATDHIISALDMNYRVPDHALQAVSEQSVSPFVRQGYMFLGAADQASILPMNNGPLVKKRVFQFNYRYPLIGGAAPIGYCLDELVEIAEGLYLGQLIYSTALTEPFHSSVDSAQYKYQLFGYFLLLDDAWEQHRQAIKLDTLS